MKCTNCQHELKPGKDFCENCGAQAPPQATGNIPKPVAPIGTLVVPPYRRYKNFLLIAAFAPFAVIIGFWIAFNGEIYKQEPATKEYTLHVGDKEKIAVLIVGAVVNFAFYLTLLSVLS